MSIRSEVLELAVLGVLHDQPLHGYELRKKLTTTLGSLRTFSYGSLYPALRSMTVAGLITADQPTSAGQASAVPPLAGKRSRIVYRLTADGKERFQALVSSADPDAYDDDSFDVRMAFFGRTDASVRLRVLEGRRRRLEERVENLRASAGRTRERMDVYTLHLQKHGLELAEREVRWLSGLIDDERSHNESAPPVNPDTS